MIRPNPRIVALARLVENYAIVSNEALDHLRRELVHADGSPATTMSDGMPRGASALTSVERAAETRLHLSAQQAQIFDDIGALASLIDSAMIVARRALGMRGPAPVVDDVLCSGAGRDGYMEWYDPMCNDRPVKAGLCSACYQRERRWRTAHGLSERDIQPIAS